MNGKLVARPTLIDALMTANGSEIRATRERLGLSQAELAERAGTGQQSIDKIERGLTRQSKFIPEIRRALGLPMIPEEIAESMLRFADLYGTPGEKQRVGVRARIAGQWAGKSEMPVFRLKLDGAVWLVQPEPAAFLPRAYPVENSPQAYGVVVPDETMAPIMKAGEIAVIDPDAGSEWGGEVFFLRALADGQNAGVFRTWIGFESRELPNPRTKTWNPPHEEILNHYFWPAMGAVVAKLPGMKK